MKNLGTVTSAEDIVTKDWVGQNAQPNLRTVALTSNAINLATGDVFTITVTSSISFTVTNSNPTHVFVLKITNGGAATVTWPTGTKWSSGAAPSLQASGLDVLTFMTNDSGATWIGFKSALAVA